MEKDASALTLEHLKDLIGVDAGVGFAPTNWVVLRLAALEKRGFVNVKGIDTLISTVDVNITDRGKEMLLKVRELINA